MYFNQRSSNTSSIDFVLLFFKFTSNNCEFYMYSNKDMIIESIYYLWFLTIIYLHSFIYLIFINDANVLNVTVYNDFPESCVIFICFSIMSLQAKSVEISSVLKDMCLPFGPQKCMYTYPLNLLTTKLLYSDTASFESPFLSVSNCFGAGTL